MQVQDYTRNDLHLTSAGRSHAFREPLAFPPSHFNTTFNKQLPPILQEENVKDFYVTTTRKVHDYKPNNSALQNSLYKKAPGHWKVSYNDNTIRKLHMKPQRKQLTMGNQSSEMKAQYNASQGINMDTLFTSNLQPIIPTAVQQRRLPKSSTGRQTNRSPKVEDRGVLSYHSDIYLTTTCKDHRPFTTVERQKYPKKEYATYWECEGYPKVWGHGSHQNPLPPDSVPRENGPMRDPIWFKTATSIPRLPKSMTPVRHKGMESEMRSNFKDISPDKRHELFEPLAPCPWNLKSAGREVIEHIPKMYETEYETLGRGRMVTV